MWLASHVGASQVAADRAVAVGGKSASRDASAVIVAGRALDRAMTLQASLRFRLRHTSAAPAQADAADMSIAEAGTPSLLGLKWALMTL